MFGDGTIAFLMLTFCAVFLLVFSMVVPVFGENRQASRRLKQRLQQFEKYRDESIASLLRQKYLKQLSPLERHLESLPWLESLSEYIAQSGHTLPAYRLVAFGLGFGVAGGLVALHVSRLPELALIATVLAGAAPFIKVAVDRQRRFARLEEQLPEAIDVLERALRAGHPFSGSLKLVAEDLDPPIAREFELTFADINYGNDTRRAMLGLLARVPSVTVMALVTSVLVQKETGGNLAEILKQISDVVRGRFKFQRRVRTLSAEGRMSAWVLAMVPLVLFGTLSFTTPDYLPVLLNEPMGQKMLMFAVVWSCIGIWLIRRIIRIEV